MSAALREILFWISILCCAALIFAFGFLVGAGHGLDEIRQQAVDEGYAIRETDAAGHRVFRWKSSDDWKGPVTRRPRNSPSTPKHGQR